MGRRGEVRRAGGWKRVGLSRPGRRAAGHGMAALVLAALIAVPCPSPCRAAAAATDASQAEVLTLGWAAYKTRFVAPEGRVVDDANGGVSHSEGQGFGMLLAASLGDAEVFLRLWNWTARELYRRPDGLASWRWLPDAVPHVTDPNNATDGDLLVAWALLRAAKRWNNPDYRAASRRIALALGQHATFRSRLGIALKPAVAGYGVPDRPDGPVVNPSYWVFPALDELPEIAPEVDWRALAKTGLDLLRAARFGSADLPTDWISLARAPEPASGFPAVFGYDAVRIPLYLAWSDFGTPELYEPFLHLVQHGAAPTLVDVQTGRRGAPFGEPGYDAVFRAAACAAGRGGAIPGDQAGAAPAGQHYYPSTLELLAQLAMRERHLSCG